jgi:hypothetical protein
MTDAAPTELTPAPKSHRRLLIILAIIAVIVIALIVGLFLYASSAAASKASDYDDDYAAWKAKEKPILLAVTAKLPKGLYDLEDDNTTKSLAAQKKACDVFAASRQKLTAGAGRLPTMGHNGLLAKVSSDYSDAGDTAERRTKAVRAYVKTSSATLAQLERDCRWNIAYNRATAAPQKLYDKAQKYTMTADEPGVHCSDKNGCLSSIRSKRKAYADLRIKAIKMRQKSLLGLLKSKDCERTSYRQACRTIATSYARTSNYRLTAERYVITAKKTVDDPNIDKHNAKHQKLVKKATKVNDAAVLAVVPELKKNKNLRGYLDWTDVFFANVADLEMDALKDARAAFKKL